MVFQVSAALQRGFDRVLDQSGLLLVAALTAVQTLFVSLPPTVMGTVSTVSTFGVSVLATIGLILSMAVIVVTIRIVLQGERRTIPEDAVRRRIGIATANMVIGYIVALVVIGVGFLLIIPGLYLLVSLLFWPVFVAGEDLDFIDAFRQSWSLTRGHKWRILLFVIGLLAGVLLLQVAGAFIAALLPGVLLDAIVISVTMALGVVWSVAATTMAYRQIRQ